MLTKSERTTTLAFLNWVLSFLNLWNGWLISHHIQIISVHLREMGNDMAQVFFTRMVSSVGTGVHSILINTKMIGVVYKCYIIHKELHREINLDCHLSLSIARSFKWSFSQLNNLEICNLSICSFFLFVAFNTPGSYEKNLVYNVVATAFYLRTVSLEKYEENIHLVLLPMMSLH